LHCHRRTGRKARGVGQDGDVGQPPYRVSGLVQLQLSPVRFLRTGLLTVLHTFTGENGGSTRVRSVGCQRK